MSIFWSVVDVGEVSGVVGGSLEQRSRRSID